MGRILPMTGYVRRVVDEELDDLLSTLSALSLEGAKGVGKTATALQRAKTVHELDRPGQLEVFQATPQRVVQGEEPILVDEWQRMPESWDLVRRCVDQSARPARFLLTGSASPQSPPTHSGAARIVRVPMRPLSLAERGVPASVSLAELLQGGRRDMAGSTQVGLDDYVEEILASGFPGMRGLSGRALRAQLDGYLARIVDRDFPEMGHKVRNPAGLRRWMQAYAAATSTTASFEVIRDAATSGQGEKPAKTTAQPYRDTLERLWLLDPIPAWSPSRNQLKELAAAPKHNLVDPALAARLLGVDAGALLEGQPVGPAVPRNGSLLGCLFESLIALNLRVYAQAAEARIRHLRTHRGEHEIDFIAVRGDHRVLAIEVKLSHRVEENDLRHLHWLAERIGPDLLDAVVLTTGTEAYRRSDGIAVVPAALLGP